MVGDAESGLEAVIQKLEADRAEAMELVATLSRKIGVHRASLAELRGEDPPEAPRRGRRIDDARSRLVQRVLSEAREPLSRVSIQAALESLGHQAEADDISSTLTYLRRQDPPAVVRHDGNRWWVPR